MEDSEKLEWAMNVVIKQQLRDLIEQLHERGHEVAVVMVNPTETTYSHLGSRHGECFISEQGALLQRFLRYCQRMTKLDEEKPDIKKTRSKTKVTRSTKADRSTDGDSEHNTTSGVNDSPARPTRKRSKALTARYMEGMASLKKRPRRSQDSRLETISRGNKTSKNPDSDFDNEDVDDEVKSDPDYSGDDLGSDSPIKRAYQANKKKRIRDKRPKLGLTLVNGKPINDVRPKRKRKPYKTEKQTMPSVCDICGQTIQGYYNLLMHKRRIHDKIRNAECDVCAKTFFSNEAVDRHMLHVHTRQCMTCEEYVVESVPWGDGIDMKSPRDVVCSCGSVVRFMTHFGRTRKYRRLGEVAPDTDDNDKPDKGSRYACGECGKVFSSQWNCERHAQSHEDAKNVNLIKAVVILNNAD